MEFIGRERELETLNASFGEPCAFLVYGRRRIGKTALLRNFCRDKRSLYLTFIEDDDNLQYLTDAVSEFTGSPHEAFTGYYEVFREIGRICAEEPTVVVLDEFQFLAARRGEVVSIVQQFIDHRLQDTGSMLILCGSSVRFMRSLSEDGSNPLFGRFKRILRIGPLSFEECRLFHPRMSDPDCMRLYLTVGGIPRYHRELDGDTYEDCIKGNLLGDGWLTEEANALIRAEFSPGDRYIGVLSAISRGAVRLKDISEAVGVDNSTCKGYLQELTDAGIIGVVHPMMGAPKRPIYFIRDDLFAFHYGIIVRRWAMISNGNPDESYRELAPYIDGLLGGRFEIFCADFIRRNYPVTEIGRWWRDDPRRGIHQEIDVVARVVHRGNRMDLFAECKFTRDVVGFHAYNLLDRTVLDNMGGSNARLCLMSISGFDPELEEFAEGAHVLLIGPEELYGHRRPDPLWNGTE